MGRTATILTCALLAACWQSHALDGADVTETDAVDPGVEIVDVPVEPEVIEEPVPDPIEEETDPCADGYPPEPYGCSGSIEWDHARMSATWIDVGDTFENFCLPNQDDELVCLGEHFCSPDVDFIVIASNTFW